ncbi:hypothetical protein [Acinetobacter sp. CE-15]|uniref:hypothetical protein n=1 Tax=Acinetobacter sp. CE-15 TaxID=3425693 RepID=UPI003DA688EA
MTTINNDAKEFKKGDLVIAPILDGVFVGKIIDYRSDIDKFDVLGTTHWDWYNKSQLRHAETKAGHSLDDVTDHVTDIRNHVSPSTMVVDL